MIQFVCLILVFLITKFISFVFILYSSNKQIRDNTNELNYSGNTKIVLETRPQQNYERYWIILNVDIHGHSVSVQAFIKICLIRETKDIEEHKQK